MDDRHDAQDPDHQPPEPARAPRESAGLTSAEVAIRMERGEVNRVQRNAWLGYRDIIIRNVVTLFNALVVPAAVALFLLSEYRGAWAVSAMAIFNTLLGLAQEVRAKHQLDRLALLSAPRARVLRDAVERVIPADEVVIGDHLVLSPGESVVADGVVMEDHFLEVDEALLTGESDPVRRQAGDRLLSGCFCVAGDGVYRADRVGAASFVHQTADEARRYHPLSSPLQRTLDALIRVLTATAIVLCLLYVVLHFTRGFPRTDLWQMIAATVTSMVPQGLVLMTTLAYTVGAVRLSGRGVMVQRLSAVESMAGVDILCMDKTGTLTTGQLSLARILDFDVSDADVRARLRLFAWASADAGNKSILALRGALGPLPEGQRPEVIDQVPFKAQNRYSAVRVQFNAEPVDMVLGAFEALRPFLTDTDAARVEAVWQTLLPSGLRLLAFAEAPSGEGPLALEDARRGVRLRPLALVALSDELRPGVGAILAELASQGVGFKILSGDNPVTVRATLRSLDLPLAREPVVSGDELDRARDPATLVRDHSVFGRVTPAQKLRIIHTLQADGRHIGMIGDGVNDILAIKRADLGIAMGAGVEATKTVAGLVLQTNDFALLPATLAEGRTILGNLRRAAKLFLLKNVYTLFLIVAALGILDLGFPYLPQQVTLLNALTIGGPAFLLTISRRAGAARTGFLREVGWFACGAGLAVGIAGLAVWLVAAWGAGGDVATCRSVLLSTLVLAGLGNVLLVAEADGRLYGWAALALPAYLAVLYFPPIAYFFALIPLNAGQWGLVGAAAGVTVILCGLIGRAR
jgi:cation-transporting P-type ATPase E